MNIVMMLGLAIVVFVFGGIAAYIVYEVSEAIYRAIFLRYDEPIPDVAKVVRKEYNDNYIMQMATKTYPLGLYDEYNVYISHNGETHRFNNAYLYQKVKVGDFVHILIHNGYNQDGELKHTYISIEE